MHNGYEIYMLLEGSFTFFVDGENYELHEGDLCWICPGVKHQDLYSANQQHKQAIMSFDFMPSNYNQGNPMQNNELKAVLKQANANRYWIGKDTRNCRHIFELVCNELSRCEVGSYLIVSHLLSILIFSIIQCMQKTPAVYQSPLKETPINNKARQISKYMDDHHAEDITLEKVAEHLNITTRHINRLLNEHYGTTFSKLLATTRLSYAKNYMFNTDYSVEKIAELVGLSSSRILYKYIKEIEGITITEYRQQKPFNL